MYQRYQFVVCIIIDVRVSCFSGRFMFGENYFGLFSRTLLTKKEKCDILTKPSRDGEEISE